MSEATASDTGFLSVAEATGLLDAAPDPVEPENVQAEPDAPTEADPTAEDDADLLEAIGDEDAEQPDPATPAIAAPQSWDAEARAVFATLSPEAQQVIVARDKETSAAVNRAQNEAADVRKRAESEVQNVTQLRAATEQVLNRADQIFKSKWDNIDWSAWAQQDPAAYVAGKAQFDAELATLAQLQAAHQAQQKIEMERLQAQRALEMQHFQATKLEQIKTMAPELIDPVKGAERVQNLEKFLESNGISREIFHTLDAFTISLANDGMKYRQLRAKAANKSPEPTRAAVKPAAAAQVRSPQRAAEAVNNRFRQTRSIDDAVAALNSRT